MLSQIIQMYLPCVTYGMSQENICATHLYACMKNYTLGCMQTIHEQIHMDLDKIYAHACLLHASVKFKPSCTVYLSIVTSYKLY